MSRGELVEIGGSFRLPDVMERAGVRLIAVGTTNRTRAGDYRAAAAAQDVGLFLKVHTSNYRVVGFTEEVSASALAALGSELGIKTALDLGSGLVDPPGAAALALEHEPLVGGAVASGVDLVMFSGDKLLGGPQAGLLVGRRPVIDGLRQNALYRALRLDKVAIAGLERTLELYLEGRADEIPARALLLAPLERLAALAERLAAELADLPGFDAQAIATQSAPGSGSAPTVQLESRGVAVAHERLGPDELAARLRAGEPPVFARIADGRLIVDVRTLLEGDDELLLAAFRALAAR